MKTNNVYLMRSILGGAWFMHKETSKAYLPLIAKLLKGESVHDGPVLHESRNNMRIVCGGQMVELSSDESINDVDMEEDSIVIIPVLDEIVKYDQPCGPVGMVTRARQVREASANENVKAIVFLFDTPGGEAGATEIMETAIKQSTKQTFGLVQGLMCSAGMWIGSACDHLFISSETDIVGSIGTMITLADYSEYFTKQGIKLHDIYADASKDKNQDYHQALKGNYKPIKQNLLNPLNDVFKATIMRNRPGINKSTTLSGRTFVGSSAISQGLVDGKTSLELLIKDIMFGSKFKSLEKFRGKSLSAVEMKALEKELVKLGIKGVRLQEPVSLLMETAEGPSIYVYAEDGEEPVGKQCVYADEAGAPTEDNVEDGDHEMADGSVATVSTHDDGLSYIDSITEAEPTGEDKGDEEDEEEKKPGAGAKKKVTSKKTAEPAKTAAKSTKKLPTLSAEGKAILSAVRQELGSFKEDLAAELEELRGEITSDGDIQQDANTTTTTPGVGYRGKDGMSAIQRKQKEIAARTKKV